MLAEKRRVEEVRGSQHLDDVPDGTPFVLLLSLCPFFPKASLGPYAFSLAALLLFFLCQPPPPPQPHALAGSQTFGGSKLIIEGLACVLLTLAAPSRVHLHSESFNPLEIQPCDTQQLAPVAS